MGYDFSSPFFHAVIIDPDGSRYPLWMKEPDTKEIPPGSYGTQVGCYPWVTSLTIETQLARLPIIKLELNPPFAEAIAFLESPAIVWGRSMVEVQFGYSRGTSGPVLFPTPVRGVLTKPTIDIGQDVRISLEAQGVPFSLNRMSRSQGFTNMSRLEIIRAVIETYSWVDGVHLELDASGFESTEELAGLRNRLDQLIAQAEELNRQYAEAQERGRVPRSTTDTYNREYDRIQAEVSALQSRGATLIEDAEAARKLNERLSREAGAQDDWYFINQLAWEAGCFLQPQGRTVKLMSRNQFVGQRPLRSLRFFYYPKGQLGTLLSGEQLSQGLPILSLSSPTPALWLPAGISRTGESGGEPLQAGVLVRGMNADERVEAIQEFNDSSEMPARIGTEEDYAGEVADDQQAPPDRQTAYQYEELSGNLYDDTVQRMAQAEFQRLGAGTMIGVQLEIETLGVPEIQASETVGVSGIGRMLDGNYGITKVEHRFENGGFTTTLSVISNAAKVLDPTRGVTPSGPINYSTPQEDSSSAGTDTETEVPTVDPEEVATGETA